MTPGKVKLVASFYLKKLTDRSVEPKQSTNPYERAAWCAQELPKLVDEGHIEKAMRWLGFIQGTLFAIKLFTVDELKDHSREISPIPCLNEK